MLRKLLLTLLFIPLKTFSATEFEIIIPTYNNQEWCIRNISSVVQQSYPHWHAIIIVDCAADATASLLEEYISQNNLHSKITLQVNETRRGALANIYMAATTCPGHKVICLLDGDDWLFNSEVLAYYNDLYETYDIWVTYGQFMSWPSHLRGFCRPYPKEVIKKNEFRKVAELPSHFRTFYAWLFQKIDIRDLMYEGEFFPMTWDQAIMFPLMEMAAEKHLFVANLTYVYNESNPINDHKVNVALQQHLARVIRAKKPYQKLKYTYAPNKHKKKVKRK